MTTVVRASMKARGSSRASADRRRESRERIDTGRASGAQLTGPNGTHMRCTRPAREAAPGQRALGRRHGYGHGTPSQAPVTSAAPPVGSRTAGASTNEAGAQFAAAARVTHRRSDLDAQPQR